MIRLLIAEDSDPFRSALSRFLEAQPAIKVVGQAATLSETIRLARKLMPDVVLLDLHLRGNDQADPNYVKTQLLFSAEHVPCMSVWNDEEPSYGAVALLDKASLAQDF